MTPEPIANFTAYFVEKIPNAIVIDGCCCVGGNLIQFALRENVKQVIGVELDHKRISYAEHNCLKVYNIPRDKLTFVHKSIIDANLPQILSIPDGKLDKRVVFFFDPPWGGLDYKDK